MVETLKNVVSRKENFYFLSDDFFNGSFEDYKRTGGLLVEKRYSFLIESLKKTPVYHEHLFDRGFSAFPIMLEANGIQGFYAFNIPVEIKSLYPFFLTYLSSQNPILYLYYGVDLEHLKGDSLTREELSVVVNELFSLSISEERMFNPLWVDFQNNVWKKLS